MESSGDGRGTRPWLGAWMCPTVDRSCLVLPTDGMDGLSTGVAEKLAWESLFDAYASFHELWLLDNALGNPSKGCSRLPPVPGGRWHRQSPRGCGFEPDLPSLSDPDPTLSILRFGPGWEVQGSRGVTASMGCNCILAEDDGASARRWTRTASSMHGHAVLLHGHGEEGQRSLLCGRVASRASGNAGGRRGGASFRRTRRLQVRVSGILHPSRQGKERNWSLAAAPVRRIGSARHHGCSRSRKHAPGRSRTDERRTRHVPRTSAQGKTGAMASKEHRRNGRHRRQGLRGEIRTNGGTHRQKRERAVVENPGDLTPEKKERASKKNLGKTWSKPSTAIADSVRDVRLGEMAGLMQKREKFYSM